MDINNKELADYLRNSLTGRNGFDIAEDGGTVTGNIVAIQSVGSGGTLDTTVGNTPDLAGRVIPSGIIISGRWDSVKAASGATNIFFCYYE